MSMERHSTPNAGASTPHEGRAKEAKERVVQSSQKTGAAIKDAALGEADRHIEKTSSGLKDTADRLRQAADDLSEKDAWLAMLLQRAAGGVGTAGDYLSGQSLGAIVEDAQRLARRNPAAFLGGGVALGFLLARVGKTTIEQAAAQSAGAEGSSSGDRRSTSTPARTGTPL